jgi:hypothetical protein
MTTRYSTAAAPSGRQLNMELISGPFLDARPRLNRLLELQIHPTKFNNKAGPTNRRTYCGGWWPVRDLTHSFV